MKLKFIERHSFLRQFSAVEFTLLELLVVTTVMIILISLILPALQTAKNKSKAVACIGNQKQIISAAMFYADDHGGNFLVGSYSTVQLVYSEILANGNYLPNKSPVLNCPGQPVPSNITSKCITYGGNMTYTTYRLPYPSGFAWYCCYSLIKCSNPARNTLFGDSVFRLGTAYFPNQCYRYYNDALTGDGGIFLGHPAGIANMAFIDGHIEGCNSAKLKNIGITAYIDKKYNEYE